MITQRTSDRVATPPCAHVLGVPVHIIELTEVLQLMERWIQQRDGRHWIAVTGSHGIVEGHKHPEFKTILKSADLSVPDGKWAARVAGRRASCPAKQVRGCDLLWAFSELASRKGYRSFFYGDTEEVLALLASRLSQQFSALRIVGTYSPPFRAPTPEEDTQITNLINQANPDVLWVGLGLPKQEQWIVAHRERLHVPVVVAVGAALKFVSGKVKAAPHRLSELGLEWVWRFAHEPRRLWHRVVVYGPQFVAHTLLELHGWRKYE
jgi:N-acetylglucosaminyldiphosphoundecaprenol N-acetyl-beta-D-mannosaminyltransferase